MHRSGANRNTGGGSSDGLARLSPLSAGSGPGTAAVPGWDWFDELVCRLQKGDTRPITGTADLTPPRVLRPDAPVPVIAHLRSALAKVPYVRPLLSVQVSRPQQVWLDMMAATSTQLRDISEQLVGALLRSQGDSKQVVAHLNAALDQMPSDNVALYNARRKFNPRKFDAISDPDQFAAYNARTRWQTVLTTTIEDLSYAPAEAAAATLGRGRNSIPLGR